MDALIDQARSEPDQNARNQIYAEIQRILAEELPYINLWYYDNVMVHIAPSAQPDAELRREITTF